MEDSYTTATITDKDLSILADRAGGALHLRRMQLLAQVLDRTSLQILLTRLQVCTKIINTSEEKKQIEQEVSMLCFLRDRGEQPETSSANEPVCPHFKGLPQQMSEPEKSMTT